MLFGSITITLSLLGFLLWFFLMNEKFNPSSLFYPDDKVVIGRHVISIEVPPSGVGWGYYFHAWELNGDEKNISASITTDHIQDGNNRLVWFANYEDKYFIKIIKLCETHTEASSDYNKIKPTVDKLISSPGCLHAYTVRWIKSGEISTAGVWICDPAQKTLVYLYIAN